MQKIAITLGDPAGIGPEVALKAVSSWKIQSKVEILFLGKARFFNGLAKCLKLKIRFHDVSHISEWKKKKSSYACYFHEEFPEKIVRGCSDKRLTTLAVRSIELAVRLAMEGKVDAIVTPPINKAGLKKAGFQFPGHTEYLAQLSRTKHYEMMLVGGNLRVVLVTRHTPLKDVPKKVTRERVEESIRLADEELRKSFGIKRPRLVICGLNPHAGEEGTIGLEEVKEIIPAVRNAKKRTNAKITGPLSPDALFYDAHQGRYDAEICMYHDQGLIPLKMISRGSGVNVTLGLPFIRTSPDHGTAYDIASKFIADPGSMIEAFRLASELSKNRKKYAHAHRGS